VPTSGIALGYVRDELVIAGAGREGRIREALEDVSEDYDLILIDCAPSLDQLTINGLTAAHGVIVVTHSRLWSANGLAQLLQTITSVREHYNATLRVAGIIVNQHEDSTVGGR
ncbi:ParA family protein, partial [Aeromicrobium phragmitis]